MTDRNMTGFHVQKNMGAPFHLGFERLLTTPMPVFTFVGNAKEWPYLDQLHSAQPDCLILGRETSLEGFVAQLREEKVPAEEAASKYFMLFDSVPGRPKYVYWIVVDLQGEWGGGEDQDWKWLAKFDKAFAILANAKSYRVCLGNMSEGNPPELPYNSKFSGMWSSEEYYRPVLDYINSVGSEKAIFQRHCYRVKCLDPSELDAHFMRFKYLYEYTEKENLLNVFFALGEGIVDVPGWMSCDVPETESDGNVWRFKIIKETNAMLASFKRLYGVSLYTYDASGDGHGDYRITEEVFNLWQSYAKTLKIIQPTSTPTVPSELPPLPPPQPSNEPIVVFRSAFDSFEPRKFADDNGDQMIPPGFDMVWSRTGKVFSKVHGELYPSREAASKPNSYILWGFGRFDGALVKKLETEVGSTYLATLRTSGSVENLVGRRLVVDLEGRDDPTLEGLLKSIEAKSLDASDLRLEFIATSKLVTIYWKVSADAGNRVDGKIHDFRLEKIPSVTPPAPPPPEKHGIRVKTIAGLNLRVGPGTNYDIQTVMPKDSEITVYGPGNNTQLKVLIGTPGWFVVKYGESIGYGAGSYLKLV